MVFNPFTTKVMNFILEFLLQATAKTKQKQNKNKTKNNNNNKQPDKHPKQAAIAL